MLKEIDLHVTNRCNNNCIFCSFNSGNALQNELTKEEILDIILQAEEMGVEDIHITGGEPSTRKDLFEILNFAKNNFSGQIRMISNGNLLTREYLKTIHELGVNNLMLSLDGDEETHDELRRHKGSYKNVINAAKNAIDLGFIVRFSLVANKKNIHLIKNEIINAAKLGVKLFSIFLMSPIGRGKNVNEYILSPKEWIDFSKDLKEWYNSNTIAQNLNLIVERGYQDCNEPINVDEMHGRGSGCSRIATNREYIMINAIGNVYPCVFWVNTDHNIGNIRNVKLKDIIHNDNNWKFFYDIQNKPSPKCNNCNLNLICKGGCQGLKESGYIVDCASGYYQLCPLMKESYKNKRLGGSSEEVSDE